MALTNAEKQARWRERHLDNDNGTKTRAQFVFDVGTTKQLKQVAAPKGRSVTPLIREWAANAERRIVERLSPREEKRYYDGQ
jgi:hypothetical protein